MSEDKETECPECEGDLQELKCFDVEVFAPSSCPFGVENERCGPSEALDICWINEKECHINTFPEHCPLKTNDAVYVSAK